MGTKISYKTYSKEFKEETVDLVQSQGYSVPETEKHKIWQNSSILGR